MWGCPAQVSVRTHTLIRPGLRPCAWKGAGTSTLNEAWWDRTAPASASSMGGWVEIAGETLGFEAIAKESIERRVPMAMSKRHGVLERADGRDIHRR